MRNGYVTDLRHYLNETGELAPMPGPAVNLALFQGSIVGWVTRWWGPEPQRSNVPCRRSSGGARCRGEIVACLDGDSGYISWCCPACGDHGMIHGWEGTRWDRRAG